MTVKTAPKPVITADARAHTNRGCRRAIGKDLATGRDLAGKTVTACTYCKPSAEKQEAAMHALIASTQDPAEVTDLTLTDATSEGPDALTELGDVIRQARRDGVTIHELAKRHGMTGKEVRVVLQDVVPDPKPAKVPAQRKGKKAAAPAPGTGSRPRKDLPPVTERDYDLMLDLRSKGVSWRGVEAQVAHLQRSSSPIRKLVLAEAARRGVKA